MHGCLCRAVAGKARRIGRPQNRTIAIGVPQVQARDRSADRRRYLQIEVIAAEREQLHGLTTKGRAWNTGHADIGGEQPSGDQPAPGHYELRLAGRFAVAPESAIRIRSSVAIPSSASIRLRATAAWRMRMASSTSPWAASVFL